MERAKSRPHQRADPICEIADGPRAQDRRGVGRVSDAQGLVRHAGPGVSTGLDLKAYLSLTGLPFRTLPPSAQRTPPRGFLFETPLCKADTKRATLMKS